MEFTLPLSYYWKLITTGADDAFQPGEPWNDVGRRGHVPERPACSMDRRRKF